MLAHQERGSCQDLLDKERKLTPGVLPDLFFPGKKSLFGIEIHII